MISAAAHCDTLRHIATHCNTLQHTATHYNKLQHTATHCNTAQPLQHPATPCNTIQRSATHCNTPEDRHAPTAHCNILQHTAHYITLQHTATIFNTLQHTWRPARTQLNLVRAHSFMFRRCCIPTQSQSRYVAICCSVLMCAVCPLFHGIAAVGDTALQLKVTCSVL